LNPVHSFFMYYCTHRNCWGTWPNLWWSWKIVHSGIQKPRLVVVVGSVWLIDVLTGTWYLAGCSLETSGRLMELNTKDGRLHVSYSDRLVTLVREVRMLLQRGFAVPAKIQHVAQVAEKFKLHANILKQVSSN